MEFVRFNTDHVLDLADNVQLAQLGDLNLVFNNGSLATFVEMERERTGMHYTVMSSAGEVLGCGGIFSIWPQRAQAWTMASENWGARVEDMKRLIKFVTGLLDTYPAQRIEATVLVEYEPGHRWLRCLGFEMEAERMRNYDPQGRDFALYARLRS